MFNVRFWNSRVLNINFVVITKNKSGGTLPPILWATETNVFFNKRIHVLHWSFLVVFWDLALHT